jgi:hypothetical protein
MTAFMVDRDIDAAKVLADRYMRSWRSDLPLYLDGTIASIEAHLERRPTGLETRRGNASSERIQSGE